MSHTFCMYLIWRDNQPKLKIKGLHTEAVVIMKTDVEYFNWNTQILKQGELKVPILSFNYYL